MSHALLGTVVPKTKESENAFSTGCQTSDNKINSSASLEESVINVGVVLFGPVKLGTGGERYGRHRANRTGGIKRAGRTG